MSEEPSKETLLRSVCEIYIFQRLLHGPYIEFTSIATFVFIDLGIFFVVTANLSFHLTALLSIILCFVFQITQCPSDDLD